MKEDDFKVAYVQMVSITNISINILILKGMLFLLLLRYYKYLCTKMDNTSSIYF